MGRLRPALVQVYTGDGKGKTTAALGLALRAVGQGLRVCLVQFVKGAAKVGELKAAPRLAPELTAARFGIDRQRAAARQGVAEWWTLPWTAEDRRQADRAASYAESAVASEEYDLVILDEINFAVSQGLLPEQRVLDLVRRRPAGVELVLTGRDAPAALLEAADLVTEMREVKHPSRRGVMARRGIEF